MVSSMITNYLIKASIIGEKQRELYEYSIKSLFGILFRVLRLACYVGSAFVQLFFCLLWFHLEVQLEDVI